MGTRKKSEKNEYIWCGMGVLLVLGSEIALSRMKASRRRKKTTEKQPEISVREEEPAEKEPETAQQEEEPAENEPETAQLEEEPIEDQPETIMSEVPQKNDSGKKFAKYAGGGLYFLLILGICIVPLLFLCVRPTQVMAENRALASLPEVQTQEGFNWNFLQEAGAYFEDHFIFRQEMVSINAGIRSEIFGVSSVDDVVVGENGWLYYTATLDDYQHKNNVSERSLFNIAHNVALMQEYSEGLGKTFVFTIAPNKNSLYDENMPERLCFQVAEESDTERLLPWLLRENVNYLDLFELFGEQEEILYYARDSHWNEKGAVMVYNALLDACEKKHETYEGMETVQKTDYFGDLGTMLFPVGQIPENRIQYPVERTWRYLEGEKAEDPFIRTENVEGEGSLLMYRDSFGNSLLPYMAQTFSQAIFSQQVPYPMSDLETWEPDILIVEKVERHLPTLGKVPPLMDAPVREMDKMCISVENTTADVCLSEEDNYWKLEGTADAAYMDTDSPVYVEVDDGIGAKLYEAFCVSAADMQSNRINDYGYILYVSKEMLNGNTFDVRVMIEQENAMVVLAKEELSLPQEQAEPAEVQQEETVEAEADKEETFGEAETEKAAEAVKEKAGLEEKQQANEQVEEKQSAVVTEIESEVTEQPRGEELSGEKTQPGTQEAAQDQGSSTVTEESRVYMEDCGSDTGYWIITYSDGHVEYVDD